MSKVHELIQKLPFHVTYQGHISTRVFLCDDCWTILEPYHNRDADGIDPIVIRQHDRRYHILTGYTKGWDACPGKCPGCGKEQEGGQEVGLMVVPTEVR